MCVGNSKWLFNIRKSYYMLISNTPNSSKSFKNLDKKKTCPNVKQNDKWFVGGMTILYLQ